jgi:hypothetical protein
MPTRCFRWPWTCFLPSQIQRGKTAVGQAAGGHRHRAPQRRRRRNCRREAAKLVYGVNSPYTRQPELATIGKITLADLAGLARSHAQGQADRRHQRRLRSRRHGSQGARGLRGLPPVTPEPPRHDEFAGPKPGVYFIDKEDVNQSNVQIVGIGIDRHNPDVPAIVIMDEILGGGFGSRLFQKSAPSWGWPTRRRRLRSALRPPRNFPREVLTKSVSTVDATKAAIAKLPASTQSRLPRSCSAPRTTSSTRSSSATTRATKSWPRARGSSSTATRRLSRDLSRRP